MLTMWLQGTNNILKEIATVKKITATILSSLIFWLLFLFLVSPNSSFSIVIHDVSTFFEVVRVLMDVQTHPAGYIGVILPMIISILVGITAVYTFSNIYKNYSMKSSMTSGAGSLLGLVTAGCSSCGVGLLAFLGVTSLEFLPYDGLTIQAVSILILVGALEYAGRNNSCKIPQE